MKKSGLILLLFLLAGCTPAFGEVSMSGGGSVNLHSPGAIGDVTPNTIKGTTVEATVGFTGAVTGNASTATALAANGANCSAGQYPKGVDASGAVESCTAVTLTTDVTGILPAANGGVPTTTKGDLAGYSITTNARVPVGTDGQVLTADSTQALGLKWAAAGGGATVYIKTVTASAGNAASQTTSSGVYANVTGYTVTVTPTSASSKFLVIAAMPFSVDAGVVCGLKIIRNINSGGDTTILVDNRAGGTGGTGQGVNAHTTSLVLDAPATALSTEYRVQFARVVGASGSCYVNAVDDAATIGNIFALEVIP